jgi:hypothetical protein
MNVMSRTCNSLILLLFCTFKTSMANVAYSYFYYRLKDT